jgi:hypothetical protein
MKSKVDLTSLLTALDLLGVTAMLASIPMKQFTKEQNKHM